MKYLVFNVGCIECGESSFVVGTYDTEDQAEEAMRAFAKQPEDKSTLTAAERYFAFGQNNVEVHRL